MHNISYKNKQSHDESYASEKLDFMTTEANKSTPVRVPPATSLLIYSCLIIISNNTSVIF